MPVSIVTIDGQNRIIALIDKNLVKVIHEIDNNLVKVIRNN